MNRIILLSCACAALAFAGCNNGGEVIETSLDTELRSLLEDASPDGNVGFFALPNRDDYASIPQDARNPLSTAKVALGQQLFHESALAIHPKYASGLGTYSCASCHQARAGFQAGVIQGIGDGGSGFGIYGEERVPDALYAIDSIDVQPIRTPSALNSAYQEVQLWNGQFGALGLNEGTEDSWETGTPKEVNHLGFEGVETQAIAGLTVHRMGVDTIANIQAYRDYFDQSFPEYSDSERYTKECAGLAIAAYERTLLANRAPFQKWLDGDQGALTTQEKEGAVLFFGKAGCVECHTGPALNSMEFYALGMADLDGGGVYGDEPDDATKMGRGGFTGLAVDMFKFKVPQLYNLTDAPFYGHGGNYESIRDILVYKNEAQPENSDVPMGQLAESFIPLGLSGAEIDALVAFLENGLHDGDLLRYEPSSLISGNCFPNNDEASRIDLGCD